MRVPAASRAGPREVPPARMCFLLLDMSFSEQGAGAIEQHFMNILISLILGSPKYSGSCHVSGLFCGPKALNFVSVKSQGFLLHVLLGPRMHLVLRDLHHRLLFRALLNLNAPEAPLLVSLQGKLASRPSGLWVSATAIA